MEDKFINALFQYEFIRGSSVSDAARNIYIASDNKTNVPLQTVSRWFNKFDTGDFDLSQPPRNIPTMTDSSSSFKNRTYSQSRYRRFNPYQKLTPAARSPLINQMNIDGSNSRPQTRSQSNNKPNLENPSMHVLNDGGTTSTLHLRIATVFFVVDKVNAFSEALIDFLLKGQQKVPPVSVLADLDKMINLAKEANNVLDDIKLSDERLPYIAELILKSESTKFHEQFNEPLRAQKGGDYKMNKLKMIKKELTATKFKILRNKKVPFSVLDTYNDILSLSIKAKANLENAMSNANPRGSDGHSSSNLSNEPSQCERGPASKRVTFEDQVGNPQNNPKNVVGSTIPVKTTNGAPSACLQNTPSKAALVNKMFEVKTQIMERLYVTVREFHSLRVAVPDSMLAYLRSVIALAEEANKLLAIIVPGTSHNEMNATSERISIFYVSCQLQFFQDGINKAMTPLHFNLPRLQEVPVHVLAKYDKMIYFLKKANDEIEARLPIQRSIKSFADKLKEFSDINLYVTTNNLVHSEQVVPDFVLHDMKKLIAFAREASRQLVAAINYQPLGETEGTFPENYNFNIPFDQQEQMDRRGFMLGQIRGFQNELRLQSDAIYKNFPRLQRIVPDPLMVTLDKMICLGKKVNNDMKATIANANVKKCFCFNPTNGPSKPSVIFESRTESILEASLNVDVLKRLARQFKTIVVGRPPSGTEPEMRCVLVPREIVLMQRSIMITHPQRTNGSSGMSAASNRGQFPRKYP